MLGCITYKEKQLTGVASVATTFSISLDESDWDPDHSGWHCAALSIPGAEIESIYARNSKLDPDLYKYLHGDKMVYCRIDPEIRNISINVTIDEKFYRDKSRKGSKYLSIVFLILGTVTGAGSIEAIEFLYPAQQEGETFVISAPSHFAPKPSIGEALSFGQDEHIPNPTGLWSGEWDGTFHVEFMIKPSPKSSTFYVQYRWIEHTGEPLSERYFPGEMHGNVLDMGDIKIIFSESKKESATAHGNFPIPRIAELKKIQSSGF